MVGGTRMSARAAGGGPSCGGPSWRGPVPVQAASTTAAAATAAVLAAVPRSGLCIAGSVGDGQRDLAAELPHRQRIHGAAVVAGYHVKVVETHPELVAVLALHAQQPRGRLVRQLRREDDAAGAQRGHGSVRVQPLVAGGLAGPGRTGCGPGEDRFAGAPAVGLEIVG